jgi:predicted O-methyltransferase YrrM
MEPADVDAWFADHLPLTDPALDDALARAANAGLPPIAVSAAMGAFLGLLARVRGARRVLEVGTLGGYSTIHLARAVPTDGRVTTLEIDPRHADVARTSLDAAGVGDRVDVLVGAALDTLPTLARPTTWCSSTPTSRTTPPTSAPRSHSPGRAP